MTTDRFRDADYMTRNDSAPRGRSLPWWLRARWSPMAGSACLWRSSCWRQWGGALFKGGKRAAQAASGGARAWNLDLHHVGHAGNACDQNAIPMPFFGTAPFAAPGLGIVPASSWRPSAWAGFPSANVRPRHRAKAMARPKRHPVSRELAAPHASLIPSRDQPRRILGGRPPIGLAILTRWFWLSWSTLILTQFVLPQHGFRFPLAARMGRNHPVGCRRVWSGWRLRSGRLHCAGCHEPAPLSQSARKHRLGRDGGGTSDHERGKPCGLRRGRGGLPAFEMVRDWVLGIGGRPLVSLAVATNILAR